MICKAAIVGIPGPMLDAETSALLKALPPAGVILFRRNVENPAQLRALTASLRAVLPEGAVLMVDQEGGRVARLRPPHWRAHPAAGSLGPAGARAAWLTGALIGLECAEAGFDVVCAPVLDRRLPGYHDVTGDRSYGADPDLVAALGRSMAEGLMAAGVQPVMKHLPGLGRSRVDSHLSLPVVDDETPGDLVPFQRNADLPWAMTAHILFPALDPVFPATLSARIIAEVIRGRIGFQGLLVSDDLAMEALTGTPAERAVASLVAGCDLALYCPGGPEDTTSMLEACPPLTTTAAMKLQAARARADAARIGLDAASLSAERDALLA